MALVVDEVNVGQTKHVKLRVLGASNKDYWDWVQNGDHPNPGWFYWTAKKLKDSKAAKVSTDKTEPSLPLACFRELDACDGPTLDLDWVKSKSLPARAIKALLPPGLDGEGDKKDDSGPAASSKAPPHRPPPRREHNQQGDRELFGDGDERADQRENRGKTAVEAELETVREEALGAKGPRDERGRRGPFQPKASGRSARLSASVSPKRDNPKEEGRRRPVSPEQRGRSPRGRRASRSRSTIHRRRKRTPSDDSDVSKVFRDASHSTSKPSNQQLVRIAASTQES